MNTPDLDAIQRRLPYIPEDEMSQAERDRAHLFAYARDLEARVGRVEAVADGWLEKYGPGSHAAEVLGPQKVSIKFAVNEIRAALAASDTP